MERKCEFYFFLIHPFISISSISHFIGCPFSCAAGTSRIHKKSRPPPNTRSFPHLHPPNHRLHPWSRRVPLVRPFGVPSNQWPPCGKKTKFSPISPILSPPTYRHRIGSCSSSRSHSWISGRSRCVRRRLRHFRCHHLQQFGCHIHEGRIAGGAAWTRTICLKLTAATKILINSTNSSGSSVRRIESVPWAIIDRKASAFAAVVLNRSISACSSAGRKLRPCELRT